VIVLWRTTTRCNYACGFCAYDRRLGIERDAVDMAEAARFGRLLVDWSRLRQERVMLSWLGGEPLLWPPIWKLSAELAAAGLAISATTNGSTLRRADVRARLLAHFTELTVSIDGPAAVHDRLRGSVGAWARVRDGVRTLVDARGDKPLKLRANVVLMRDTIGHFAELCMTLAAWGVDEITFNQLGGRDRPTFYASQRLWPADITVLRAMLPDLRNRLAQHGVVLCGDLRYLDRLRASAAGEALAIDDCRPGESFLFVDERGIVAPCSFSGDAYGVATTGLRCPADIDGIPARFRAGRRDHRLATCDDCPSTQTFAKFAA
jgi:MoaA/NifB/PqqE/SkfB family radical SAM enzyme